MATSVVQHASNTATFTSGTSGTVTATFGVNTTAGNCLVACVSVFQSVSSSFSPSIGAANTNGSAENWASAVSQVTSVTIASSIIVNPNTGGGQKIINVAISFGGTATSNNNVSATLDTYEVSGVLAASVVDKTSSTGSNTGSATTWTSNATATTTVATEMWIGVVGLLVNANSTTETVTGPSSPWTNETLLHTTVIAGGGLVTQNVYQLSGFQAVSSTGAATYNGTNSQGSRNAGAIVTLKGSTATNVSLTVAQVTIAAPSPTVTVTPQLPVAQVNINALSPKLGAGPVSLTIAQVNVNARTPGISSGPILLPVAQVNINAPAPATGSNNVTLAVAQVTVNALPFTLEKTFGITCAQVSITAYPPGISRPGTIEDTIVPLMVTGVYSNV